MACSARRTPSCGRLCATERRAALTVAMRMAAAIPLPMTSPRVKLQTPGQTSCQSKKSPPTCLAGRQRAATSKPGIVGIAARQELRLDFGRIAQFHLKLKAAHLALSQGLLGPFELGPFLGLDQGPFYSRHQAGEAVFQDIVGCAVSEGFDGCLLPQSAGDEDEGESGMVLCG